MNKLLSLAAVVLFACIFAMTLSSRPNQGGSDGVQARLIGSWRLAWLQYESVDGKIHKEEGSGLLVFTMDGHMSLQVMRKNPPAATDAGPLPHEQSGYQAFFGTFQTNKSTHIVTFHVDGALERTLVGKSLARAFEFSGKQLIVKSTSPDEPWTVAWEHF